MEEYTKNNHLDNPLIRLAEYQPKTRWQPGDPLPKNQRPDAHAALERNADAFALHEAERQRKILPFKRKPVPQVIARDGGLEAA